MTPKSLADVPSSPGSPQVILLATDFCAPARCALACARQIARLRRASVRALHVLDLTGAAHGERPPFSVVHDSAASQLREIRRELRLAGVSESATLVAAGRPARAIRQTAEHYQPALLILGLNGSRSRKSTALGTTARALLADAPCPILTVAPPCPDRTASRAQPFARPLLITDTDPRTFRAALAAWPETAALMRIVLPPGAAEHAPEAPRAPTLRFPGAARALLHEAADSRAGIVVLALRAGGYLDSFATGSFAHAILTKAHCPVLTVRC
ncbi:MAG TPA: universal stress protein [Acidobacteriaceae bacterium]|nr:universal stress protein [Acidobacteriaceae bacterium]